MLQTAQSEAVPLEVEPQASGSEAIARASAASARRSGVRRRRGEACSFMLPALFMFPGEQQSAPCLRRPRFSPRRAVAAGLTCHLCTRSEPSISLDGFFVRGAREALLGA